MGRVTLKVPAPQHTKYRVRKPIMANDTFFVRNRRPNRVVIKYADLRVALERNGAREDSVALPAEARNEPSIARWLRQGILEEISKNAYLELQASLAAFDPNHRSEDEPDLVSDVNAVELPLLADPRTPNVVDLKKMDPKLLSPRLQYLNEPEATDEPEYNDPNPKVVEVQDLHRGERPFVAGDKQPASVAPKARKKTTTRSKSPRKK
jgi:hypothetical protein